MRPSVVTALYTLKRRMEAWLLAHEVFFRAGVNSHRSNALWGE